MSATLVRDGMDTVFALQAAVGLLVTGWLLARLFDSRHR
jgi:hypothetical protein